MTSSCESSIRLGCFGLAMTFSMARQECVTCEFGDQCSVASNKARDQMNEALGISGLSFVRGSKQRVAFLAQVEPVKTLPKKVVELLDRFEQKGIRIAADIGAGVNPFLKSPPKFMAVACHLVMGLSAGLTRATLISAFQKKLGWSAASSAPYATVAFQLLIAADVAHEIDGKLKLKVRA